MTDQDKLRDRIAYVLESHAHMAMDQQACAIIDEFGLTVEERFDEPGKRGINPVRRIVGEWEKQ